jgi:hypothetical protein
MPTDADLLLQRRGLLDWGWIEAGNRRRGCENKPGLNMWWLPQYTDEKRRQKYGWGRSRLDLLAFSLEVFRE